MHEQVLLDLNAKGHATLMIEDLGSSEYSSALERFQAAVAASEQVASHPDVALALDQWDLILRARRVLAKLG